MAKWGNSVGVRLPKEALAQSSLRMGTTVNISVEKDGCILLSPARTKATLAELVEKITPDNKHSVVDWGHPTGEENW